MLDEYTKFTIEEFEKTYIWFPLRYGRVCVRHDFEKFIFDEKGFYIEDDYEVTTTLNEMGDRQRRILVNMLELFIMKMELKADTGVIFLNNRDLK